MFAIYGGLLTICLTLGFVTTLTIELPFANLLKLATSGNKGKREKVKDLEKGESLVTTDEG
jgi:hypothetical protein